MKSDEGAPAVPAAGLGVVWQAQSASAAAAPAHAPGVPLAELRRGLRRSLIERREALAADVCAVASALVVAALRTHFPQLSGLRVGFCWPMRNEIDLRPLLLDWLRAARPGFQALLPVVVGAAQPLAFRAWIPGGTGAAETPLALDRHGIPYPASGDFVVPEALLVPVNAVDAAGYRLGYGGGYFDRTLAAISPRPLAIGIGFDFSRVATVWPQAHDEPLDALVSDAAVFRFKRHAD
ncbi:5-formyltetrahydrofolate cyclo-ligase [Rhodocyclus tenuis]|uniref:5-formyltetrahydrofolate cyclo-ligase n=1 Tax=Rhodocyclus tenuis TaxID=1066 RepID=A0A840G0W9_RHOTE|nr:5-formyltetrahydrofolate cyclo-ligase [Rhodocyclus tenuis]MBB4246113.1 5,10-methenyltetrahydrofolate synthetase [Rhodocyclus tenuis]